MTLAFSAASIAGEEVTIGFAVDVNVGGSFFAPRLEDASVKEVVAGSSAELAGLVVGQKILSIDGCDIPGCPAKKAQEIMQLESGDLLPILVEESNGTQSLITIHVK